jgi:hypothetical protein
MMRLIIYYMTDEPRDWLITFDEYKFLDDGSPTNDGRPFGDGTAIANRVYNGQNPWDEGCKVETLIGGLDTMRSIREEFKIAINDAEKSNIYHLVMIAVVMYTFYGGKGWTFKSVGKYQITATYNGLVNNPKEELRSNVVEVNIRAPQNEQEKDQVNLIMGDEQGLFLLFEAGDHLSNGIRSLTELASKYPQSDLAGYANFALGMSYSKDFKDFQRGFVRKADTERALLHLKSAKDRNVDGYFARQAYLTLANIYEDSNVEDAKKETLNEFIERFSRDSKHADSIKKAKSMLEEVD